VSSDFQSSSPGSNESGKQTFDDARSREELENLQQEESSQCVSWADIEHWEISARGCLPRGAVERYPRADF